MPRLGLCCIFRDQPIKFRTTTAAALGGVNRKSALIRLSDLCLHNAESLYDALTYCHSVGIGSFRINSGLFPLRTHPQDGYDFDDLPNIKQLRATLKRCRTFALEYDIRTTFHPDQFVVLNSPRAEVVASSLTELEHQAEMAELIGADVINIHAGGAYGDKEAALERLAENLSRLSRHARSRLTLENDDRSYTPVDLLPLCWREGIPLVYDVHHHRVNPDSASAEEVTEAALSTWNREPLFHISSPINGWSGSRPFRHHDFIDPADFPDCWRGLDITVEVEAKAKELAVLRLLADVQ